MADMPVPQAERIAPRIEHELRVAIGVAILAENALPDVLGVGEDHAYELPEVVLARGLGMLERRPLRGAGRREVGRVRSRMGLRQMNIGEIALIAARAAPLHQHGRVDAEEPHQSEDDENPDDADAAARGPNRRRSESSHRRRGTRRGCPLRPAGLRRSRSLFRRASASKAIRASARSAEISIIVHDAGRRTRLARRLELKAFGRVGERG